MLQKYFCTSLSANVKNKVLFMAIIFLITMFGCGKKTQSFKQLSDSVKHEYPDGLKGNYLVLSNKLIKDYHLTDEKMKELQFYTAQDVVINLYVNRVKKKSVNNTADTNVVDVKTIGIKKFTPCVVIEENKPTKAQIDWANKEELRKERKRNSKPPLSKEQFDFLLKSGNLPEEYTVTSYSYIKGYVVDVGGGTFLIYNPDINYFTDILKLNNTVVNYSDIRFPKNSGIIVNLSQPVDKYINIDSIVVPGKRK